MVMREMAVYLGVVYVHWICKLAAWGAFNKPTTQLVYGYFQWMSLAKNPSNVWYAPPPGKSWTLFDIDRNKGASTA